MRTSHLIFAAALFPQAVHGQSQCTLELSTRPGINQTAIFRNCTSQAYQQKLAEFRKQNPNVLLLEFDAHGTFSQLNQNAPPALEYFKITYRDLGKPTQ